MHIAFSTTVCPEWTLNKALQIGAAAGYDGIDLRTLGHDSRALACDPTLTGPAKARDMFEDSGLEPVCLSTSIRYDEPIWPPVLGRLVVDVERPVRETREMVRVSASIECPHVRVFAFELHKGERRRSGLRRIIERLGLAVTTARHTGVRLILENGGSFPFAGDLAEIIDRIGSPLLGACYSPATAQAAGEDPAEGLAILANRIAAVRLRDFAYGRTVALGDGDLRVRASVEAISKSAFDGWIIVDHDRIGLDAAQDPETLLKTSAERVYRWIGGPRTELERRKYAAA